MSLTDLFFRRSSPRWMNQEPPPYGYGGGDSPRTELRVIMCCNKCEEKVREEIGEIYGVQDIVTDQARSEVVVYGFADSHDVLKKARKVDKRADIMSTDSFTTHKRGYKLGHKHNKIHHKHHSRSDYGHGHGHGRETFRHSRSGTGGAPHSYPVETIGSPRYNSSFHQTSSGYGNPRYNSNTIDVPDYRQQHRHNGMYRPEIDYRHLHDGYRSEPDVPRYPYSDYRPRHMESRSMYDEYRPEYDEYRPRYYGYKPSQSYPPRYADERDYRDSGYPMNPDYLKQMDYY